MFSDEFLVPIIMATNNNWDEIIPVYKVNLETPTARSASSIVVQCIAEWTDQEPDELEPLWESVDPEALDSFVGHAEETGIPYRLGFQYQGYTVEIVADGELRIAPSEEPLLINV